VEAKADVTIPASASKGVAVDIDCTAGTAINGGMMWVSGGGGAIDGRVSLRVAWSGPVDVNTWRVVMYNGNASTAQMTPSVVCAS
jgi:hypothetical protein